MDTRAVIPEYIEARIRQRPPAGLPIVPGSTPVVAFGDATKATVATLGWNPSKREFRDAGGSELSGSNQRLESLLSLGQVELLSAPLDVVRRVLEGCNGYFHRCPYRWFNSFEGILSSLGVSYKAGTACHLDLVQWATDPTWGRLQRTHKEDLVEADLSFLRKQLSQEHVRLLLLNGSGIARAYSELFQCDLVERAIAGTVGVKLFVGRTQQGVRVIGWNKNLQSSFGVSKAYIDAVGIAVKEAAM